MKKKYKILLASIFGLNLSLYAGGYKVPEQSRDSMALAGSNIAKSFGADAAYYNPANMAFLPNNHLLELNLAYVYLGSTKFDNFSNIPGTTSAKSTNFKTLAPTLYYVSPEILKNTRFGFSANVPGGISIEWKDLYPASTSKKFSLRILEMSPSLSYMFNDKFAVSFGIRGVYTTGEVKSEVMLPKYYMSRDLTGDSLDFGYSLSASYKPISNLSLSATYRSKVDLTVKGNADLTLNKISLKTPASITIPLPKTLNLGVAYEIDDFTFLFDYERTFWSDLEELDFNYGMKFDKLTTAIIDTPSKKEWKDTNTYRFGIAWQQSEKLRLMAGFGIDGSIADSNKVGFELPDTKAYIYSAGVNYKVNENLDIGFGYLYHHRKNRVINKESPLYIGAIDGEFKNGDAQLTSLSFSYKF